MKMTVTAIIHRFYLQKCKTVTIRHDSSLNVYVTGGPQVITVYFDHEEDVNEPYVTIRQNRYWTDRANVIHTARARELYRFVGRAYVRRYHSKIKISAKSIYRR